MSNFERAHADIIGVEGVLSMHAADPGNWTGGSPGKGELRGTKYGISAKAYPHLDIKNLTLEQAREIAKHDYWDKYQCEQMPYAVAYQVFDTAFNGGHAVVWLQEAVGAKPDGVIGAKTIAALRAADPLYVVVYMNCKRLERMTNLTNWPTESRGWARRIVLNLRKGLVK